MDGIIIASSNGAIEDCFKFLDQMISYDEGTLTPTHFVQSTPNAPAGQLALMGKTTGYNITHVSSGLAFEGAVLDALMLFEEGEAKELLVGAVEELSECHYVLHKKVDHFKTTEIDANTLFDSNTAGSVYGEGATSFVFTNTPTPEGIQLKDVAFINFPEGNELEERVNAFLTINGLTVDQIDAVIVGMSGDSRFDYRYQELIDAHFSGQSIYTYKNLVGEYPTSSAFATWMGYQLLKGSAIIDEAVQRKGNRANNRVLIYNHYYDGYHGLLLLEKD